MDYRIEGCNLRLIATPAERKRFDRWNMKKRIGEPWVRFMIFRHLKKFMWSWVKPEVTGDMTDAPILAAIGPASFLNMDPTLPNMQQFGVIYAGSKQNGTGRFKHYYHRILRRWAFMDYQIRNIEDVIVNDGECLLQGTEEGSMLMHGAFECPPVKKIYCRLYLTGDTSSEWIFRADKGGTENDRVGLLCALNRGSYSVDAAGESYVGIHINTRSSQVMVDEMMIRADEAGVAFDLLPQEERRILKMVFYVCDNGLKLTQTMDNRFDRLWPSVLAMPEHAFDDHALYYSISRAEEALAGKGPPISLETTARTEDRLKSTITFQRNRMFGKLFVNWGYAVDLAARAQLDCDTSFRDRIPVDNVRNRNDVSYGTVVLVDYVTKNISMALEHLHEKENELRNRQAANETAFTHYINSIKRANRKKSESVRVETGLSKPSATMFQRSIFLE